MVSFHYFIIMFYYSVVFDLVFFYCSLLFFFFVFIYIFFFFFFFFSSRRRHTRWNCDWSSDVCSSDLSIAAGLVRKNSTEVAVSNRRVLIKTGFISRKTTEVILSKVESVGVDERSEERRVGKECRCRWGTYH